MRKELSIYRGGPLPEGTEVAVDVGPFRHKGLVTGRTWDGTPLITSSSQRRGCAAEEVLVEFAQGRPVLNLGFRGPLSPAECAARARAMIGVRWFVDYNCEHFVAEACGDENPSSPQLRFWMGTLVLAGIAGLVASGRVSPH